MNLLNSFSGVFAAFIASVSFIVAVSAMQLESKLESKLASKDELGKLASKDELSKLESKLEDKLGKLEFRGGMGLVAVTVAIGLLMYFMPSRSG